MMRDGSVLLALPLASIVTGSHGAELTTGWRLASSADLQADDGARISRGDYDASSPSWLPLAHFPATVLAALSSNGSAPEPDFALPLYRGAALNGTNTTLYDVPWWYRAPVPRNALDAVARGERALLTFRGINYRADVWINGAQLGKRADVEGAFRYHDVDATAALAAAATGAAIAVSVSRSYDWGLDCPRGAAQDDVPENEQSSCRGKSRADATDLGITFVDWAPAPRDANLGLWRGVSLTLVEPLAAPPAAAVAAADDDDDDAAPAAAAVTVRYPQVATRLLPGPSGAPRDAARLEVMAELHNWAADSAGAAAAAAAMGALRARIDGLFDCTGAMVSVRAGQTLRVVLTPDECPSLLLRGDGDGDGDGLDLDAVLWHPWQMGEPTQHNLTTSFVPMHQPMGASADEAAFEVAVSTTLVGLREANTTLDARGNAVLRVNGRRILVRGAGWAPDLLQRVTPERNARQLRLARDLGLNTVRLEGKFQDDDFFARASALGLMVLPGICCCDAWQNWDEWSNRTLAVAAASISDQAKRLRAHASVVAFLYSSDELPPPHVEGAYLDAFRRERWAGGLLASAADDTSALTGPTGVKMAGPYGWVPPNYWYTDADTRNYGSAFGFATEISPGAAPMTLDSMRKTVDADNLWVDGGPGAQWDYHCGSRFGAFGSLKHFTQALTPRYGPQGTAEEYLRKAQLAAYESHRAMFEGYSSRKYNATGLVQWMLNSAWPSNMWHLFDFYLQTGGSYFGVKRAVAAPLHVLYAYDESPEPEPAPASAAPDCAQVPHTDTVEGEYAARQGMASPGACCSLCLSDAHCMHSVHGVDGTCYLKNTRKNDGGNTMTPIASHGFTLCLKRSLPATVPAPAPVVKRGTVVVVNSRYVKDGAGLTAEATQFDLSGTVLRTQTMPLGTGVAADAALPLFRVESAAAAGTGAGASENAAANSTVLLRLQLLGRNGTANWYWLAPRQDRFEMGGCFNGCRMDRYADMRDLAAMPRAPRVDVAMGAAAAAATPGLVRRVVTLTVAAQHDGAGGGGGGGGIAFFTRLRALDATGRDVLPATWSGNFVTLLAGERMEIVLEHEQDADVAAVTAEPFNV